MRKKHIPFISPLGLTITTLSALTKIAVHKTIIKIDIENEEDAVIVEIKGDKSKPVKKPTLEDYSTH